MAGASLLVLLDDIAAILDDVSVMTKLAAKKTAGVLGDDLAVNAEKVTGVSADRELPVVWAVARGSLKNKCILVPTALLISIVAEWAITPLLVAGGLFLCFEGFEKIAHPFLHSSEEDAQEHDDLVRQLADPAVDPVKLEKRKISGAIRTDFILSAEIIVITLGIVADASFATQLTVLASIALIMTVGVYGLVAGIVKLDDAGLYLATLNPGRGGWRTFQIWLGHRLLEFAPRLMKLLTIVGTAAMFLVGGGILVHGIPALHHLAEQAAELAANAPVFGGLASWLAQTLFGALTGLVAGGVVLAVISSGNRLWSRFRTS
jgi:predicted DNA repair protein MutK